MWQRMILIAMVLFWLAYILHRTLLRFTLYVGQPITTEQRQNARTAFSKDAG